MSTTAVQTLLVQLKGLMAERRRHDIDAVIGRLIAMQAPLKDGWRGLVKVSVHNGALSHARAAMALLVRAADGSPLARFEQAAMLADIGDLADAQAVLDTLPPAFPNPATRAHFAATLAMNAGDIDAARQLFREALRHRPQSGSSWLGLTSIMAGDPSGSWAGEVIAAEASMAQAAGDDLAGYLYALGAAYAARDEHRAAFDAFSRGAALVARKRPYDESSDRRAVTQALQSKPIAAPQTLATNRAIVVVGPPRSGTTLVEQILASHSGVIGGGELPVLDIVARDIGGLSSPHLQAVLARRGIDDLARDYFALLSERFGEHGRVVDKTLSATRYLGMIATILPDAPLIWVRRAPIDVAWSCFRTLFSQGQAWSFDLKTIATHLRLEEMLFAHWQDVLGERLLVVEYENLTRQSDTEIVRITDHCGMTVESGMFSPHTTRRAVTTASVAQVRRPIHQASIGAATPYLEYLEPFVRAFEAR